MHVRRIIDACVAHGRAHGCGHLIDLGQPAEMLEWERWGGGATNRERRALTPVAPGALEHQPMGSHGAFSASRHDEADSRRLLGRKMPLKQQAQRKRRVTARKVVDQAVAFGLGEHRNDPFGIDALRSNGRLDAGHVVGRGGRDAMDDGAAGHGRLIGTRPLWCDGSRRGAMRRPAYMLSLSARASFDGRNARSNTSATVGVPASP